MPDSWDDAKLEEIFKDFGEILSHKVCLSNLPDFLLVHEFKNPIFFYVPFKELFLTKKISKVFCMFIKKNLRVFLSSKLSK